jgi:hypothetical protein
VSRPAVSETSFDVAREPRVEALSLTAARMRGEQAVSRRRSGHRMPSG